MKKFLCGPVRNKESLKGWKLCCQHLKDEMQSTTKSSNQPTNQAVYRWSGCQRPSFCLDTPAKEMHHWATTCVTCN